MSNRFELFLFMGSAFLGNLFAKAAQQICVTVVAMVIGTIVSFYIKKYLEKKHKK